MTQPQTIDLKTVRQLADLASTATAALLPLVTNGKAMNSHGGETEPAAKAVVRALDALEHAGQIARQMRKQWEGVKP